MIDLEKYYQQATDLAWEVVPNLLLALFVLIIGLWIINIFAKGVNKAMLKTNVEISLRRFLKSLFSIGLKALLIISVASMVGIATTSFIAILGAAGLAVGLSLQGSLANFAGGVLILLFKPYRIGDYIESQGYSGTVHDIQIFNTILKTPDNKTIVLPNGPVANGSIVNYSSESTRRVDFVFGVGYNDDIDKTKKVLLQLLTDDTRVLKDPAPFVRLGELADSSVNFTVRAWVNSVDYWNVFFDMQENVKLAFDKNGISIPYPQQDVHLHQSS